MPFLLDWVLSGEDEVRLLEGVCIAARGHLAFGHGLEERRLSLGWRTVHLVGEEDVGEHGTWDEAEVALPGRRVFLEHVGAGDVARHQVGRELNAIGVKREGIR